MSHLTPGEIVDAIENALPAPRQTHLRECDACARDVAALGRLLADTRGVDVPEPAALFWERFSDRVRAAIAAESRPRPRRAWFAWPVLTPIATLALVLIALGAAVSRERVITGRPDVPVAAVALDAATDEATLEAVWALASDLVSSAPDDSDTVLSVVPGSAERAAGALSSDEQQELMRLIQEELGKSGG